MAGTSRWANQVSANQSRAAVVDEESLSIAARLPYTQRHIRPVQTWNSNTEQHNDSPATNLSYGGSIRTNRADEQRRTCPLGQAYALDCHRELPDLSVHRHCDSDGASPPVLGEVGNDLTPALIELPISRNHQHGGWDNRTPFFQEASSPVSASRTYQIFNQNGWGRSLHFLAGWFLVLSGAAYLLAGIFSDHFWRHLLPRRAELTRAQSLAGSTRPSAATHCVHTGNQPARNYWKEPRPYNLPCLFLPAVQTTSG